MKFPYGNKDFYDLITSGYFYVDRTHHIPLIEDTGKVLLFLRPRRFGKSLLLSTLENYYDIAKTDEFARLFGHLAVGQAPTPKHNQYLILKWDLSKIFMQDTVEKMRQALHNYINSCIETFKLKYCGYLDYEITLDTKDAFHSLQSVFTAVNTSKREIYLLIDEYDSFISEALTAKQSDSQNRYEALIQGEGLLKTLFKAVKYGTEGQGIDHVFITGVSPIVMSDITSGFNIAKNIYLDPDFNDLCGFWEHEIAGAVHQIVDACALPADKITEALGMMRTFYDGYSFIYDQPDTLYNPTMVLYFLECLQRQCQCPEDILDINLAIEHERITYISSLPQGSQVISAALETQKPLTLAKLNRRFGAQEVLKVMHDKTFMISFLYFFGLLTFTGQRTNYGKLILQIPNSVIRRVYEVEYAKFGH